MTKAPTGYVPPGPRVISVGTSLPGCCPRLELQTKEFQRRYAESVKPKRKRRRTK